MFNYVRLRNFKSHSPVILFLYSFIFSPITQGQLEEVTVTAQKREQNLQEVPVSVVAIGGDDVDKNGWLDISSLDEQVSGMFFGDMSNVRPRLFLRGVGTTKFDIGSEAGVAVFVDDVYVPRFSSILSGLVDVERIEVLKGPQGTLYGRNVTGGAIKVVNKKPTEEFEGFIEGSVGNFNLGEVKGAISGALVPNQVLGRAAFSYRNQDGPHTDTVTGNTNGGEDMLFRGSLLFPINHSLEVGAGLTYTKHDAEGQLNEWVPNPAAPSLLLISPLLGPAAAAALPGITADNRSDANSIPGFIDSESITGTIDINWDLGAVSLMSISSYTDEEMQNTEDFDATTFNVVNASADQESETFSQELRLASTQNGALTFNNRLEWQLGLYYFDDEATRSDTLAQGADHFFAALAGGLGMVPPPMVMPVAITDTYALDVDTTSWAVFAQGTFDITDDLAFTAGVRHTEDEKDVNYDAATSVPFAPPMPVPFSFTNELDFNSTDFRFALDYKFNDDVMGYVSYSKGFKSGGTQSSVPNPVAAMIPFEEEILKSLEIGLKSQWLDNSAQLNVSGFRYKYDDQQLLTAIVINGLPTAITDNAASSTMYGVDVDALFYFNDQFSIDASYSYLDATFDSFLQSGTGVDLSGNRMPFTSEHSFNIGAVYVQNLGVGELNLRLDYSWKDDLFYNVENTVGLGSQESYGVLNLSGGYTWGDNYLYTLSVFCNNCADKEYTVNKLVIPSPAGGFSGAVTSFARDTEYGARFRINF